MRGFTVVLVSGLLACQPADDKPASTGSGSSGLSFANQKAGSGSGGPRRGTIEQVPAPFPTKTPPADAIKTASGLVYKKIVTKDDGTPIHRNDTVMVNLTGWHQDSGETFYSNRGRGQPMPMNLSGAAAGFAEGLQLLKKGEKVMLWMPAAIGYKVMPPQPEARAYEIEVVDVVSAPVVPDNVAKPPDNATKLASGAKMVVLTPGTGANARQYDSVNYTYTAWTADGKMLDTSETRKKPANAPPYKLSDAMGEMLMAMSAGEKARFWVDAERTAVNGKKLPGAEGQLCYDIGIVSITKAEHEPPPAPADVAKIPADAKKTAKGVSYKLIKPGPGKDPRHPKDTDTVKVHYTGWTTDGKMFDSSVLRGEPSTFNLHAVIAGWTDGLQVMTIGDTARFWIPEALAYKGQPNKPQGMLVFEIQLIDIVAPTSH